MFAREVGESIHDHLFWDGRHSSRHEPHIWNPNDIGSPQIRRSGAFIGVAGLDWACLHGNDQQYY
jgi:hypothetical protein